MACSGAGPFLASWCAEARAGGPRIGQQDRLLRYVSWRRGSCVARTSTVAAGSGIGGAAGFGAWPPAHGPGPARARLTISALCRAMECRWGGPRPPQAGGARASKTAASCPTARWRGSVGLSSVAQGLLGPDRMTARLGDVSISLVMEAYSTRGPIGPARAIRRRLRPKPAREHCDSLLQQERSP